ncbi:hypothetical protein [Canibacter zhoujuaniae]|uniref:hypothetical protein n=1 Tax=Canibacter zhoujuaniae TaxID=2708343 RepID=UPI00141E26CA|nr:hypothetical protein [Canibacter zhoujuaniae]
MVILKSIVLVLHLLSFGAIFGALIGQFKNAKTGKAVISNGIMHATTALLVTGLLLVGLIYALGSEPNNMKIGVKTAVLLVIFGLVIANRKKENVSAGVLGGIAGLLALNVALAVMW